MDNNKTNLIHSFDYACEESKKSFLTNIEGLNEAVLLIKERVTQAKRNNKQTVFLTVEDAETLAKWIHETSIALQVDYSTTDRVNRKAMRLYQAGLQVEQQCTCRHLIKAHKALERWEAYKRNKRAAA